MAIKRSFILSSGIGVSADNLFVVNNTNSVSSTTGSIVLSGGIGIGQSASISGRLQMFNGANYTSFVSSASGNTVYTLPATSPATGSSVLQSTSAGVLSWVPMTATGVAASGNTAQNIAVNSAGNASVFHPILFTPSPLSAGSAVSSDGTISFNPSTEILNVSGLAITSTTASTSTSNGALQVAGGVGISGRLSFNQASFGTTGIATNPTMAMIGQTGDPIFMTVLEDNSIAFEGAQGQLFSITPNLSTGYIYSVNDITGIPLIRANANANVTANEYAGNFGIGLTNPGYKLHVLGAVGFTSTTASTSTTTGTLVVGGGVGIGGSIFGASTISAADNIEIKSGKELRLNNSGNTFYTGIKAGANTSNTTYTFPVAFPGSGTSILQSDTSGVLAWVPMTASSSSGNTAQNIVVNTAGNANVFHPILFTPSSLSAGSAVSSDGTISFNPSTEILNVSGLAITNTTVSTSTTSGALIVTGGVGIGQSVSVDGRLQLFNSSNYTAFVSSASGNTVYTLPATSPATGSSVLQSTSAGVMSWVPMTATSSGTGFTTLNALTAGIQYFATGSSGSSFNISSTGSTHTFNIPIAGSGSTGLVTNLAQTIAGAKTFSSALNISDSTNSSSSSTGALIVTGGAGIGGTLTIGSDLRSPSFVTRKLTTVTLGATINNYVEFLTITGGLNGGYNLLISINNNLAGTNIQTNKIYAISGNYGSSPDWKVVSPISEQASNSQSGAWELLILETQGDLVFRLRNKIGFVGTSTNSINIYNLDGNNLLTFTQSNTTGTDATAYTLSGGSPLMIIGANTQAGQGQVAIATPYAYSSTTALTVSGSAAITGSTASTSTTSGALIVTGGVGIGQSVSVGGRLQLFNSSNYTAFVSSASGNTVYTLPATSPATGTSVLQSTSAGVMSWVAMAAVAASGNTAQNIVVNTAGNANVFHPVLFTPSSLSAGSAVSSDSTISFNPSTEILNVSGLAITSGTASTNTTTGALVVRGGLGVTGQLSFAQASFGFTGITTNPIMSFIGATSSSPITLTVLTDNSLNFEGSQGSVFSIDSNLSSGEIFSVSDISGLPIISASAGQTVNINEFGGYTQIGNGSINSSSTTTGSLVVSGGLGLTGNANIGGTVRITSTTASTTSSSGALVVSGGVGIGQSASIGGRLQLFNGANYTALVSSATGNTVYTLPATSPATGSSVLQSTSAGVMSWVSTAGFGASAGGVLDGSVQYKSGSGFGGTRSFFFNTTTNGLRLGNFPGEEIPTSTSAALLIEQTIGSFNGSVNGTLIAANAISGFTGDLINLQTNAITKFKVDANGAIGTSSSFNAGGDISVFSVTPATNTTSGALQVRGGAGIAQTLFVGGSISNANYFYSGGNNFAKSGQAQGDILLDNNANDTPGVLYYYKNNTNFGTDVFATGTGSTRYRIVKDLNESGGSELWSIDRSGVVTQTAWAPGEIIKMTVLVGADLTGGSTTTISTSSDTDVASYSYTPVSSNSYLVIDFITRYSVAGAAADDIVSRIAVDGAEQSYNNQVYINGAGGGTRSGVLFPLMARYTNSNTTAKTISVTVRRGTTDDNATVYKDTTTVMKITEIGR